MFDVLLSLIHSLLFCHDMTQQEDPCLMPALGSFTSQLPEMQVSKVLFIINLLSRRPSVVAAQNRLRQSLMKVKSMPQLVSKTESVCQVQGFRVARIPKDRVGCSESWDNKKIEVPNYKVILFCVQMAAGIYLNVLGME